MADWHADVRRELADIVEPDEWVVDDSDDMTGTAWMDGHEAVWTVEWGTRITLEVGCVTLGSDVATCGFGGTARALLAALEGWERQVFEEAQR